MNTPNQIPSTKSVSRTKNKEPKCKEGSKMHDLITKIQLEQASDCSDLSQKLHVKRLNDLRKELDDFLKQTEWMYEKNPPFSSSHKFD
ncbi:hypothetical protein WDU94_008520 [Cyamophila willieti]